MRILKSLIASLLCLVCIATAIAFAIPKSREYICDYLAEKFSPKYQAAISDNENLSAQIITLQEQLDIKKAEKEEIASQLALANAENQRLNNKVINLNATITNLQNQLATANQNISSLTSELQLAKADLTQAQSELEVANARINTLTSQLQQANETIENLQNQIDELIAYYDNFSKYYVSINQTIPVESILVTDNNLGYTYTLDSSLTNLTLYKCQTCVITYQESSTVDYDVTVNSVNQNSHTITLGGKTGTFSVNTTCTMKINYRITFRHVYSTSSSGETFQPNTPGTIKTYSDTVEECYKIKNNNTYKIKVTNNSGSVVAEHDINNSSATDNYNYPSGIYSVSVYENNSLIFSDTFNKTDSDSNSTIIEYINYYSISFSFK